MSINQEQGNNQACSIMSDRMILIVEDDTLLAKSIAQLLSAFTITSPIISHSVQQALDEVAKPECTFDLAIVDIMLPEDEAAYALICDREKRLQEIGSIIDETAHLAPEITREKLFKARYERSQILAYISHLINPNGGIELVTQWREGNKHFPILYLTAVSNETVVKTALSLPGGHFQWLVKPVSSDEIIEKCCSLLSLGY
jgi:DNA-binding response OmpR family regulator